MKPGLGFAVFMIGWGSVLTSCSSRQPAPSPFFASPEGAALCTVAVRETDRALPAAIVNVSLLSRSSDESLRSDLARCLRVTSLTFSDSLYGGGVPVDSALRLDLRASGRRTTAEDQDNFVVNAESCAGWPCHASYEAVVDRRPEGATVVRLKILVIP